MSRAASRPSLARRGDILQALDSFMTARVMRGEDRTGDILVRMARLNEVFSAVNVEITRSLVNTPRGIVCVHDDTRLGLALMDVMAHAGSLLEYLSVDPDGLFAPSCHYCIHCQPSSREGCIYCKKHGINRPTSEICEDGYERSAA